MKRGIMIILAVAIAAFALGRAAAQEGTEPCEEMAAWLELGRTGPEHADLMKFAGEWAVDVKAWMAQGAEPVPSRAKAVFTPLFGGRYLRQELEGDFMGQPFRGVGCTGFNNASKKYEDVWIDNVSTGLLLMTGTRTEAGVWTYTGAVAGPGGKQAKVRTVLTRIGDDKMLVESFCEEGGGERKCWEGSYTRTK